MAVRRKYPLAERTPTVVLRPPASSSPARASHTPHGPQVESRATQVGPGHDSSLRACCCLVTPISPPLQPLPDALRGAPLCRARSPPAIVGVVWKAAMHASYQGTR